VINPLNAELYPIWYLLALLGAHHILHVSRIRVKGLLNYTETPICITLVLTNFYRTSLFYTVVAHTNNYFKNSMQAYTTRNRSAYTCSERSRNRSAYTCSVPSRNRSAYTCSVRSRNISAYKCSVRSRHRSVYTCSVRSRNKSVHTYCVRSGNRSARTCSVRSRNRSAHTCSVRSRKRSAHTCSVSPRNRSAHTCSARSRNGIYASKFKNKLKYQIKLEYTNFLKI
jgi:hypothetical protein